MRHHGLANKRSKHWVANDTLPELLSCNVLCGIVFSNSIVNLGGNYEDCNRISFNLIVSYNCSG